MKNLIKISILSIIILISSCSKDSEPDPVICELTDTPTTYAFADADGNNTVSFTGQIARLEKAKEVYDMMNADLTVTSADIMALIDDANSKLLTKTAENDPNRAAIIATLNSIFDSYATSSSAFEAGTVAAEGIAGIDAYGYELDARGWEADQQFAKALIGALCLEQNAYDYLTKIDLANNNVAPDGDNAYTKSEHYFDEAFGYVYGLDEDFGATESISGDNKLLLGKYLTKHDGTSAQGEDLLGNVYNAYLMGRQAIVDNCEEELNRNIEILNINLSKVVAFHAADYLRKSAEGALDPTSTFHHAISEGWGFVMSLQFTKMADGMPLFSHAEVNDMLATLDSGENGAYSLRSVDGAATLNAMADQIDAALAASK
tara:strand:+ start:4780 stop:5904 length:1125 start_codon:yes stop_codon:yes gene_type:complete